MPVVGGIGAFRDAMRGHEGEYVLIGGAACSILFDEAGEDFRLTKDLDVVVLVDKCSPSFARDFWGFVRRGGYNPAKRKEGSCAYYRFILPKDSALAGAYPGEVELFARHPDFQLEDEGTWIAPLPFDDTISSLSAIILDDGYYEFIRMNAILTAGVPLLSALHIIPLKMRAHIDNERLHHKGVSISEKTLKKHRGDIMSLVGLLPTGARLELAGQMREDAALFLDDFANYVERETNRKNRARLVGVQESLIEVYL